MVGYACRTTSYSQPGVDSHRLNNWVQLSAIWLLNESRYAASSKLHDGSQQPSSAHQSICEASQCVGVMQDTRRSAGTRANAMRKLPARCQLRYVPLGQLTAQMPNSWVSS